MDFSVFRTIGTAFSVLARYWWVYMPVLLFFGVLELYQNYTRTRFLMGLKWVLLEIKPPPDVVKSPKIAENFFAGLHGTYGGGVKAKEELFQGKTPEWFSLEIVSNAGDMHFYIRTLEQSRDLIEASLFAQYPDAEISLADDYVGQVPMFLPDNDYDLFGSELIFTREDAYPIKTWPEFEEQGGKDEFMRSDPLSPLAEIMTVLGPGEHLWLQLLVRPTGGDWVKEAQKIIDKIIGKKEKPSQDMLSLFSDAVGSALSTAPSDEKKEKKEDKDFSLMKLTPGQKIVLEMVENKTAKLGFKCSYRFMYLARADVFNKSRVPTVIGMFKQVYSNNMNTFKPNPTVTTKDKGVLYQIFPSDKGFFADQMTFRKKVRLFRKYRDRKFGKKHFILNTEELATLWHLPGINIKAPAFPRVEAKKGTPPPGLPTR